MSRDPFEEMQERNPVSRDELPMAPMSVAERILGNRRGAMPGWAMAAAAAFMVAAVGGGMLLFLNGGEPTLPVGSGGTTTVVDTSVVVTTTVPMTASEEVLYFFLDGDEQGGGPFLVPVAVTLERPDDTSPTLAGTIAWTVTNRLLEGADGLESPGRSMGGAAPTFVTAMPSGTSLVELGFAEQSGIVDVHLSSEFLSGGGSASVRGRVAQIVYTLTAIDGVAGVQFFVDGAQLTVIGNGDGLVLDDPVTREGFDDLLPAVMIESPAYGAEPTGRGSIVVKGTANVFEATVSIELLDASGAVLFEGFTTATCGTGCRGEWIIDAIPYQVEAAQWGTLRAFESSAEDGRPTNVREHPVFLTPSAGSGDTTVTTVSPSGYCSGRQWETPFVAQSGLPEAVAATRAAIWDAAVECDWDQLGRLLGPEFAYSFGGGDEPIERWHDDEVRGDQPMLYLAELLNQPFGAIEDGEGITYYVWPSAHTKPWEEVTGAEREALRALFDEADFAEFETFGAYSHYRIGITDDGEWAYFLAGD